MTCRIQLRPGATRFDLAGSVAAAAVMALAEAETWSEVVCRPEESRIAPAAVSALTPIATSAADGSICPVWQTDPLEAAIAGQMARTSGPRVPGTATRNALSLIASDVRIELASLGSLPGVGHDCSPMALRLEVMRPPGLPVMGPPGAPGRWVSLEETRSGPAAHHPRWA